MSPKSTVARKGFTLIELLVVIAIIATLAVVVFVAFDPATRFAQARNAQRSGAVSSLVSAVQQYVFEEEGQWPVGVDSTLRQIGTCTTGGATLCAGADAACVDLHSAANVGMLRFLPTVPQDPQEGTAETTGYAIVINDTTNALTVTACLAELGEDITITR